MTTSSVTAQLRALLRRPGPALVLGAHDALSAKLAEEAGFDAIWGSGFGISAVSALPDANILTMSETLDAVQRMVEAVHIPVIADCDNGFGNAINVIRTVAQYERAGVAGLCIEDNIFPKRCSFYAGVQRELVPVEEHALKIDQHDGTLTLLSLPGRKRLSPGGGNKKRSNVLVRMPRLERMPSLYTRKPRRSMSSKILRRHGTAPVRLLPFQPHTRALPQGIFRPQASSL